MLITVDTLRADHTSAFGYDLDTTPVLSALAARGFAFARALSSQPETGPSLASILTSRPPREIGVRANGDVLPADFPTLAERFRDAGFATAAFVSTELLAPRLCGLDRGFGTYDAAMTSENLGHAKFERRADETADAAIAWLDAHRGGSRFLWLHLYDPHGKYDPGPELARRFHRDTGRPPLDPARIQDYQRYGDSLDPDDYVARYDGEIFRADAAAGRVLEAAGADAIVAFTADHGEGLGEHDYWFRHGSRLDGPALRVPLVLAGPGVPPGGRSDVLVQNLDLAPTLLDLAGLAPLGRGRSLRPLANGADDPEPPVAFAEARPTGLVAVTSGRYRLVLRPATGGYALFDLEADPGETDDLAAGEPDVAKDLLGPLLEWTRAFDRFPGAEPGEEDLRMLESHGYVR